MSSEEDLDLNGSEANDYDGDYYNSDNNDDDQFMDEDADGDSGNDLTAQQRKQQCYKVLKEADIRECQADAIERVSTVLSIIRVDASILLRHNNWSVNKVHDAWFADEDGVRKSVGLLDKPVVHLSSNTKQKPITCGICFESYRREMIIPTACGHPFCGECWTGYIKSAIDDGPECLMLRCPTPSCRAAVGDDMIKLLASEEDNNKYLNYLLRSYVEDNRMIKWCPGPGCEYAIDFVAGSASNSDVSCLCSYSFCWNCTEEPHRPVDCGTVSNWILKNRSESENTLWILAKTKPCPKCRKPIEKNQGCNNMTCRAPCRHQFCWLCLGDLKNHRQCNGYKISEDEKIREMAQKSLDKYAHYYERWVTNQKSRQKALEDLKQMETVNLKKLSVSQWQSEPQLKFVIDAWHQIIECRGVLKWTYAYGYYLPEEELAKKRFFEYLQGQAESGLERLHQCAEHELRNFLQDKGKPSENFNSYRSKLAGLTSVTRNYFENLVQALENGLEDVDSYATTSRKRGIETIIDDDFIGWESP